MKKIFQKYFVILLVIIIGLSFSTLDVKAKKTVCNNPKKGSVYSQCTTKYKINTRRYRISPVVQHKKGIGTHISVTRGGSKSDTASANLTLTTGLSSYTLSAQLGISQTKTKSYSSTVAYNIPPKKSAGKYAIRVHFPNYKLKVAKYRNYYYYATQIVAHAPTSGQYILLDKVG